MELNSLLILLEAAEYLERRDREAEHGYASVLPFASDYSRKKTKAAPLARRAPSSRSSHNELEKHRRAKLRLYLEQLKQLVPLGPDSTRHTTLSLLKRAKMHIKVTSSSELTSMPRERTRELDAVKLCARRQRCSAAGRMSAGLQGVCSSLCSREQRFHLHPTSFRAERCQAVNLSSQTSAVEKTDILRKNHTTAAFS
ncbi:max dimerization protein 4 isoform X3 [Cygnus olor]|uniref:max dimerization protein 4 isoform X3 n=1 Tax=Cygnus olor TaxID=8869 RepID=UPI001ADE0469|nr:max dimerization protein 4 isoform X3 [Cygnus olor]